MPGIVKLSRKELLELIETTEAAGGDTTELKHLLAEVEEEERPQAPERRREVPLGARVEEMTAQERLEFEVGYLFPAGVTDDVMKKLMEYDWNYSLKQLRDMCVEAGLSPSGHKKLLAAKLIAHSFPLDKGNWQGI